jgi:hypothetical protein
MTRALFLACSRRKTSETGSIPAIDRYDGPCFRVLRRYLRFVPDTQLKMWVLSSEHGLIEHDTDVSPYDRLMTLDRADELRLDVLTTFLKARQMYPFSEAFVSLGSAYTAAMSDCWSSLPDDVLLHFATGSIGGRASRLRAWLLREGSLADNSKAQPVVHQRAMICGITVSASVAEVMAAGRAGLAEDPIGASRFETACVQIGEDQVAVKWLVSKVTGVPVSRFRTADACRLLGALGVLVTRL